MEVSASPLGNSVGPEDFVAEMAESVDCLLRMAREGKAQGEAILVCFRRFSPETARTAPLVLSI